MLRHDVLPVWGERAVSDIAGRDGVNLCEKIAKRAPRVAGMTKLPRFSERPEPLVRAVG